MRSGYWFVVFLFKQKTAYEMRSSDWSSDVCSSDLLASHRPREQETLPEIAAERRQQSRLVGGLDPFGGRFHPQHFGQALDRADDRDPIGRASCRESVCQYV